MVLSSSSSLRLSRRPSQLHCDHHCIPSLPSPLSKSHWDPTFQVATIRLLLLLPSAVNLHCPRAGSGPAGPRADPTRPDPKRARVGPDFSCPGPARIGSRAKSDDLARPGPTRGRPDPTLSESMSRGIRIFVKYNSKKCKK